MGRAATTLLALVLAAGLAGCGGGHGTSGSPPSTTGAGAGATTAQRPPAKPLTLQIVADLPLTGPDAAQGNAALNGMNLALSQWPRSSLRYPIRFVHGDIGTATSDWNPATVAANARKWAFEESTIVYIGDIASGASSISIPILNVAGIPQIVPGSPLTTLNQSPPAAGGPRPAPVPFEAATNFVRLVPNNAEQALAELQWLKANGCTRLALPYDGNPYDLDAPDLAAQLTRFARGYGIQVLTLGYKPVNPNLPSGRSGFAAYLDALTRERANCAAYSGTLGAGAVAVTEGLHEALLPGSPIVGSSSICTSAWVDRRQGGVTPATIDPQLFCAAPGPGLSLLAARRFAATYEKAYKQAPDPSAAYGFEAMELALQAIAYATEGDNRDDVIKLLQHTSETDADSVIGDFGFEDGGNTNSTTYSIYKVVDGRLVFDRDLQPEPLAGRSSPTSIDHPHAG